MSIKYLSSFQYRYETPLVEEPIHNMLILLYYTNDSERVIDIGKKHDRKLFFIKWSGYHYVHFNNRRIFS